MPNPSNLAMEEQWKKEEADKPALEKAYQSGKLFTSGFSEYADKIATIN